MRVGIKYCGGCNPYIDRDLLTRHLMNKFKQLNFGCEFFDLKNCEVVLVINGCSVGCVGIPKNQKVVSVCGTEVDQEPFSEDILLEEIIKRVLEILGLAF